MNILSQDQVVTKLSKLDVEWAVIDGVHLEKVYSLKDFKSAIKFVNKVANTAETHNHHPDIEWSYTKVIVRTTTHEANGLTEKDFNFAQALDKGTK